MPKVRLELGAELDMLSKDEMGGLLDRHGSWEREAAYGMRQTDLPMMQGAVSGAAISLGADQAGGTQCGPPAGWYWAVHRISVDGLGASDVVKVWKDSRFICAILQSAGSFATFGKGGLTLKGGENLLVKGTGLAATGTITVYGEATSVPGPLMWKIL